MTFSVLVSLVYHISRLVSLLIVLILSKRKFKVKKKAAFESGLYDNIGHSAPPCQRAKEQLPYNTSCMLENYRHFIKAKTPPPAEAAFCI